MSVMGSICRTEPERTREIPFSQDKRFGHIILYSPSPDFKVGAQFSFSPSKCLELGGFDIGTIFLRRDNGKKYRLIERHCEKRGCISRMLELIER